MRDPTGWSVSLKNTKKASIEYFGHKVEDVPILGNAYGLTARSKVEVITLNSRKYVLVHPTGPGGGCVACYQRPKQVVPYSFPKISKGNPMVQAVVEEILSRPIEDIRLYDLELIEPRLLTKPLKVIETLMGILLKEEHWGNLDLSDVRFRLLVQTRKFVLGLILQELKKHRTVFIPPIGSFKQFFSDVENLAKNKDKDCFLEASWFKEVLENCNDWVPWLETLEAVGTNIFSVYFGGTPPQSHNYIFSKVELFTTLSDLTKVIVLDQASYTSERVLKEVFIHFLQDSKMKTITEKYFKIMLLTGRISEAYFPEFLPLVKQKRLKDKLNSNSKRYVRAIPTKIEVVQLPREFKGSFFGRKKDLAYIHSQFNEAKIGSIVIQGSEGIGKSRLVYEYALQHQSEYEIVYWVYADTTESLYNAFRSLGQMLGLFYIKNIDSQVEYIKAYLEKNYSRVLLIFDSAFTESELSKLVPDNAKLIITTQNKGWKDVYKLKPLSDSKSISLCKEKLTHICDREDLIQLYKGNPLCLVLMASFISLEEPFVDFNEIVKCKHQEVYAKNSYCGNVFYILVNHLMVSLKDKSERAFNFLCHLSFFHSAKIPPLLYNEVLKLLGYSSLCLYLKHILTSRGLILIDSMGNITINKSLAEWVRSDVILNEPYVKVISAIFHRLAFSAYSQEEEGRFSDVEAWSVHFECFFSRYQEYYRAHYMEGLLYYCHLKMNHHGTLSHMWLTEFQIGDKLEFNFKCYDISRPHIMLLYVKLNDLSEEYSRRIDQYLTCLQLQQEKFADAKYPDLADAYYVLGNAELEKGMVDDALAHHLEALSIRQQIFVDGHHSVGKSLQAIAGIHKTLKSDHREVLKHYYLALDIYKKSRCAIDAACVLELIAGVLADNEKTSEARDKLEEALEIFKQLYGEHHLEVAFKMINLAKICVKIGENTSGMVNRAQSILKEFYTESRFISLWKKIGLSNV